MELNDTITSSRVVALLIFTKKSDIAENSSGLFCWKQLYSGYLLANEGIWTHTRIFVANLVQISVLVDIISVAALIVDLITVGLAIVDEITHAIIPSDFD